MSIFGIVKILVVGFVVGLLARAFLPGDQKLNLLKTTVLGVLGSILGGVVAALVDGRNPLSDFQASGFVGSILGAIVVLFVGAKLGAVENR